MLLPRYFGQSTSWENKDTRSKKTPYIRITRAPFYCKRMGGKCREVVTSSEREIFCQVRKGNLCITYCPTDDMTADYMTKPLQGKKFRKF